MSHRMALHQTHETFMLYKGKNAFANMLIYPGEEVCRGDDIVIQKGEGGFF